MEEPDAEDRTTQVMAELQLLQEAIAAATREGDIRRNARLNVEASRLRRELNEILAAQATA